MKIFTLIVPRGNFGTINDVCHEKFPPHKKFLFLARIPHHKFRIRNPSKIATQHTGCQNYNTATRYQTYPCCYGDVTNTVNFYL